MASACVTGGNGFVALCLIKQLLEKGYSVNATVRDLGNEAKVGRLKQLRGLGRLAVFQADLEEEGSFDEAVNGCDYVFLVAAPVNLTTDHPEEELIKPAVQGTLNVLRSCVKAKDSVKRVVLTSSCSAVSINKHEGVGLVMDKRGGLVRPSISHQRETTYLGNEDMIRGLKELQSLSGSISFVHVEDLCRAHIFVAENELAVGRYICCAANTSVPELARFLRMRFPQYSVATDFDKLPAKAKLVLSSEKLLKAGFEYKYKEMEEIYADTVGFAEAIGFLAPNASGLTHGEDDVKVG